MDADTTPGSVNGAGNPAAGKEKLVSDLKTLVSDANTVLGDISAVTGASLQGARADLQSRVALLRDQLRQMQSVAVERARLAADRTEGYVKENPWTSVAVVAGIGVVVGLLLRRRD